MGRAKDIYIQQLEGDIYNGVYNNEIHQMEVTPQGVELYNQKLNQMNKKIFNKYVSHICKEFYLEQQELFAKDKRTDLVDARHLLYYLSIETPMTIAQLIKYMKDNEYDISHSSIYHGYNKVKFLSTSNSQWKEMVKRIQSECIN